VLTEYLEAANSEIYIADWWLTPNIYLRRGPVLDVRKLFNLPFPPPSFRSRSRSPSLSRSRPPSLTLSLPLPRSLALSPLPLSRSLALPLSRFVHSRSSRPPSPSLSPPASSQLPTGRLQTRQNSSEGSRAWCFYLYTLI
jgi:hypothetical protein